jgi:hypothetical protein
MRIDVLIGEERGVEKLVSWRKRKSFVKFCQRITAAFFSAKKKLGIYMLSHDWRIL